MNKLFALVCVSLAIGSVYSAVAIVPSQSVPEKYRGQSGCYDKDLDIMLPNNEMYSPDDRNSCLGYYCKNNNETQVFSCGVAQVNEGCVVTEDLSLQYPKCCKQYDCPKDNGPSVSVA